VERHKISTNTNCLCHAIQLKIVIIKNKKSVTHPIYAAKTLIIACNKMTELTSKCQVLFGLQVLRRRVENAGSKMPPGALLRAIYSILLGCCRPEGAFISLISSDLIWWHLYWPHFTWSGCTVNQSSSPQQQPIGMKYRSCTFSEVCSDWSQPQRILSLYSTLGSVEMRSVEIRWDEMRWDKQSEHGFMSDRCVWRVC